MRAASCTARFTLVIKSQSLGPGIANPPPKIMGPLMIESSGGEGKVAQQSESALKIGDRARKKGAEGGCDC